MTTLEKCLGVIANGGDVRVSFSERCVWVGKTRMEMSDSIEGYADIPKTDCIGDTLLVIEDLYDKYKHSRPGKEDTHRGISAYFEAIPYEKLTPEDLLNEPREEARIRLEVTVLGLIINGSLYWEPCMFTGWRYVSPSGLTLKRKWVDPPQPSR